MGSRRVHHGELGVGIAVTTGMLAMAYYTTKKGHKLNESIKHIYGLLLEMGLQLIWDDKEDAHKWFVQNGNAERSANG